MENGHDFVLWCRLCGKSVPCTMDDLDALRRDGYPSCCDEIMTMYTKAYFLRGERPTSVEPSPADSRAQFPVQRAEIAGRPASNR